MKKYKLKLDYTADELNELKRLRKTCNSLMCAISELLIEGTHGVENLQAKYLTIEVADEFDFMADINNAVMGTAIFPEEKYVVRDTTDHYIYYDELLDKLRWSQPLRMPEKKTKDEWLAINPAYESMLEKVEDDER